MTRPAPKPDDFDEWITPRIEAVKQVQEMIYDSRQWVESSHKTVDRFAETLTVLVNAGSVDESQRLCDLMRSSRDLFFDGLHSKIDRLVHDFQNQIDEHRTTHPTTRQR